MTRRSHRPARPSNPLARGRRFSGPEPFARELGALAWLEREAPRLGPTGHDAFIDRVLVSAFGDDAAGRYWSEDVKAMITFVRLDDAHECDEPVRRPLAVQRRLLGWLLRRLGTFRRHGSRIYGIAFNGREKLPKPSGAPKAPYCPTASAGGVSARVGLSTRRLRAYARASRAKSLIVSYKPRPDDPACKMPRRGDWPYRVWTLSAGRQLPPAALRRLREAWNELPEAPRPVADAELDALVDRIAPSPARAESTGPPLLRLPPALASELAQGADWVLAQLRARPQG